MIKLNPQWSDDVARRYCGLIYSFADRHKLPAPKLDNRCQIDDELGEGVYGVVYKTEKSGTVFKITSDESEARVVGNVIELENEGANFRGLVRYRAVRRTDQVHDGLPVFLIWREESSSIGGTWTLPRIVRKSVDAVWQEAQKLLKATVYLRNEESPEVYWKTLAAASRKGLDPQFDVEGDEYAGLFRTYVIKVTRLRAIKGAEDVADTILELMMNGMVLADVHHENIGKVQRGSKQIWAVTDPGNAIILKRSLEATKIPLLKG